MKKLFCMILMVSLLLSGCGGFREEDVPPLSEKALCFTDDLGRSVAVDSPARVAVLLGSHAESWVLAGGTVCAAADDVWEEYDLELPEDTVNLGNTKSLSLELLLSARPDFVIASAKTNQHLQWRDTLEAAGIPVAYFDVADFGDYLRMMEILTDITGRKDLYQTNALAVQTRIDAVLERSRLRETAPRVLILRTSASGIRAKGSEGNVLGEILSDLGCENIADSETALLENLSIEHILVCDPDYIFIAQHGDDVEGTKETVRRFIRDNPAWAQLTAVRSGRVFYMEKELFTMKPNNRWDAAYEKIEEILSNG